MHPITRKYYESALTDLSLSYARAEAYEIKNDEERDLVLQELKILEKEMQEGQENTDDEQDDNTIEVKTEYTQKDCDEYEVLKQAKKDHENKMNKLLLEELSNIDKPKQQQVEQKTTKVRHIKKASKIIYEDYEEPKQQQPQPQPEVELPKPQPQQEPIINTYVDSVFADYQRQKKQINDEPKIINTAPSKYDKTSRIERANTELTNENIKLRKQLEELQVKLQKQTESYKAATEELKDMQKYKEFYNKMNNTKTVQTVSNFLKEKYVNTGNPLDRIKCNEVYQEFNKVNKSLSQKDFYKLVDEEGFTKSMLNGTRVFKFIKTKPSDTGDV